jgi:hypothetical protein
MILNRYTIYLFSLLLLGGSPACKRTVSVRLDDAPPQVVIEGEIINQPGPYQVKIPGQ